MANIKELIQSIESNDSSFDEKLAAITKMEETLVAMRQQEEKAVQDNVDLIVEAIKVMENKVTAQLEVAKSIVPEKGDKGDKGDKGADGRQGIDGKNGRDGQNGKDGIDGKDGVSVSNAQIDFDGSLVITLSTGQEINVGEVVAPELQERIKLVTSGGAGTVLPDQASNSGKYLTTNGSALSWASVAGGLSYQGTWNASTNTPTLASGVGVNGYYYITATAGSTNLDGITDWQIGDWLLFNGANWQKIDQSNLVISVAGRTGAVTLSNTDISGLGTMSTQNASSVAITGGTATLTSLTTPTVQATNSGGLSLKNSVGTTQLSMGAGGGDNLSLNVSTNINGTNAQVDISPTGTGHVHIKPTGVNSIEIAPTYVGDIDNMIIGAVTPKNGSFVDLSVTGTTSFDGSQGTSGQVLTSAGSGNTPTWSNIPTLNQNTTGSAGSLATTNFTIEESGGKLLFKYGATTIASMSSTGVITSATNIIANGTP
jgi:hypothetical protein